MKQANIFLAVTALTLMSFFPAVARADEMDDLEVTMEVLDDPSDLEFNMTRMRGPDDGDVDEGDWQDGGEDADDEYDDEADGRDDDESEDAGDLDDGDTDDEFEHDDELEEEEMEDEDDFEDGEDVDDDEYDDEYDEVRTDSLVMFGAALGGAILGMLLTLLMLAVVNGGTLNFARSADKVEVLEATLARVNENVGAVSNNVDAVAARTDALAGQLAAVEAATQAELTAQANEIADINDAVASLDTTREQFDVFMGALSTALDDVSAVGEEEPVTEEEPAAEAEEAPAEETATDESADLPLPSVQSSTDLGPNDVQVILFADANNDGMVDDGETSLVGINVSLIDPDGVAIADGVTGDEGALFEDLAAGEYTLVVDETLGYELLSQGNASLVVGENGAGMVILIPVDTTAE